MTGIAKREAHLCVIFTLISAPLLAAPIAFDLASNYDGNFWEPSGARPGDVSWVGDGYLRMVSSDPVSSASAFIYNTHSIGGSSGSGGTSGGLPLDKFGGADASFTILAEFSSSVLSGGHSFGFYTNANDAGTSGYLALFRITNPTTADFRLFESNSNLSTAGVGAQEGGAQFFTTAGNFGVNTFYRFELTVSNGSFTAKLFEGTNQIGATLTIIDSDSPVNAAGQVGVRVFGQSGSEIRLDNFEVVVIPEPSICSLLCLGIFGFGWQRSRARSCREITLT